MPSNIDYLRLGTWDAYVYSLIAQKVNEHLITKPGHWLQYHGRRGQDGSAFHGTGKQDGKVHHICHFSGETSQEWAKHLKSSIPADTLYCTRIDVQTTIKRPKEYDPLKFYELSKRTARSIVLNPETSTVYLGARSSDLFMRLYEKIIDEQVFLRLEFELKGAYSRNWWEHWRTEPELIDLLFTSCANRIGLPEPYVSWFNPNDDKTDILNAAQLEASLERRLTYLRNTESAMVKYLYDHSTREHVVSFVERMSAAISKLDT